MWQVLLGNVLKGGTTQPEVIKDETKVKPEEIALYIFAGLALVAVLYFIVKSSK